MKNLTSSDKPQKTS